MLEYKPKRSWDCRPDTTHDVFTLGCIKIQTFSVHQQCYPYSYI